MSVLIFPFETPLVHKNEHAHIFERLSCGAGGIRE
jgi:hypothetical protein